MKRRAAGITAIGGLLLSGAVLAQDIPVRNWEVPGNDLSKLAVVNPTVFSPISPPCRLDDSRLSSGGVGPIPSSGTRLYDFIPSGGVGCGALPSNVVALSVFFTVVGPSGSGFLYAYPSGSPPGSPTSIVNYNAGELKNAAAIIPVAGSGAFTVAVGGAGTDLIIDLNGVFYNELGTNGYLYIESNRPGGAVLAANNISSSTASGAIQGFANGAGVVYGVSGSVGPATQPGSTGVQGSGSGGNRGVTGVSESGSGVYGFSTSGNGVFSISSTSDAISGITQSTASGVAGVFGGQAGLAVAGGSGVPNAGVKGTGRAGRGVIGLVDSFSGRGISGYMFGSNGVEITSGHLGVSATTGVLSNGDIMATGPKFFVEPHPTDPSRMIRFVSLEGNEAGTYFRGKAKFERGLARIPVPEDFRMVTDPEGLSIQVTPIAEMASVAVVRIDLEEIVVKGSRNVEFFYTVNGVREAYKDVGTVVENDLVFVPERPDASLPHWLSEKAKARLVRNGTYNPDGTVNIETARRLGWDKAWAKN